MCRERERLEQEAQKTLYLRHEEAYRRTIGVGRYELSLDILQEDLDDAREKLVMLVTVCHTAVGLVGVLLRANRVENVVLTKLIVTPVMTCFDLFVLRIFLLLPMV